MALTAFLAAVSLTLVSSVCYVYQAQDPPLYCDNWVNWPISDTLDAWNQSHIAFQHYYKLKEAYLAKADDSPTLDCLAIAQEFYCAHAFPYCDSEADPSRGICSFLCELYSKRCPAADYDYYCSTRASSKCSLSAFLSVPIYLIALLLG